MNLIKDVSNFLETEENFKLRYSGRISLALLSLCRLLLDLLEVMFSDLESDISKLDCSVFLDFLFADLVFSDTGAPSPSPSSFVVVELLLVETRLVSVFDSDFFSDFSAEDFFVVDEPQGEHQQDGEYCDQYTGYSEDSGSGVYYCPSENIKEYLAISYTF